MKTKRLLLLSAIVIALLAVYASFLLATRDKGTRYEYATYEDLKRDTSVKAASVPHFVPVSAHDIDGWYSIELNAQALEFSFDPSDQSSMASGFRQATGETAREITQDVRKHRWKRDVGTAETLHAFFVEHDNAKKEFLLIDVKEAHAYYVLSP